MYVYIFVQYTCTFAYTYTYVKCKTHKCNHWEIFSRVSVINYNILNVRSFGY